MRKRHLNEQGLTLLELLIVVAIVGVLSAIAIVNYLVALDKTKQKKTMADIRSIASAWEARASDRGAYTAAGQSAFNWPGTDVTQGDLEAMLSPTYIRPMARFDGWGYPLDYAVEASGPSEGATVYAIRSPGRGGTFETEYPTKSTTRFDCDIVFSNGQFVVAPVVK
jgi:prepilin-type N-terminal cleavage/methylation domain-containing protein